MNCSQNAQAHASRTGGRKGFTLVRVLAGAGTIIFLLSYAAHFASRNSEPTQRDTSATAARPSGEVEIILDTRGAIGELVVSSNSFEATEAD
ncbi:MAG TPA: hypothetical protein VM735_02975 [Candidatus Kapabacteria bacterium]|nr:hypothetical protein [Candidatus Kapabacteria bacterium]